MKSTPALFRKSPLFICEEWFGHPDTFETFKVPAKEPFRIAYCSGVIETFQGPMEYERGHAILTGPMGEEYPITPEKFKVLKEDNGDGTCAPKKILKQARLADHDGKIVTSWGDLVYTAGNDYIVRHGDGDYGAVKVEVFAKTYNPKP